jgi:hypothetical protein
MVNLAGLAHMAGGGFPPIGPIQPDGRLRPPTRSRSRTMTPGLPRGGPGWQRLSSRSSGNPGTPPPGSPRRTSRGAINVSGLLGRGHARRQSESDPVVITYWIPRDQFDDYLYPPLELAPAATLYSLRQRLPGRMIKNVDKRAWIAPYSLLVKCTAVPRS